MSTHCPRCNTIIKDIYTMDDLLALKHLTQIEMDALDKLVTDHPNSVDSNDLANYIYAFSDKPKTRTLNVFLHHLKKKLLPFGWCIKNTNRTKTGRKHRAKYKLFPEH